MVKLAHSINSKKKKNVLWVTSMAQRTCEGSSSRISVQAVHETFMQQGSASPRPERGIGCVPLLPASPTQKLLEHPEWYLECSEVKYLSWG